MRAISEALARMRGASSHFPAELAVLLETTCVYQEPLPARLVDSRAVFEGGRRLHWWAGHRWTTLLLLGADGAAGVPLDRRGWRYLELSAAAAIKPSPPPRGSAGWNVLHADRRSVGPPPPPPQFRSALRREHGLGMSARGIELGSELTAVYQHWLQLAFGAATELSYAGRAWGDKGLSTLLSTNVLLLAPQLASLDLSANGISEYGQVHLALELEIGRAPALRRLGFEGNGPPAAALDAVCRRRDIELVV